MKNDYNFLFLFFFCKSILSKQHTISLWSLLSCFDKILQFAQKIKIENMNEIKTLVNFLKELEKENLIELKMSDERLEIIANKFLTGQNLK